MGQKTIITGWRTANTYDRSNKVSDYVYSTGFKHSSEVALYGSKANISSHIKYANQLNRLMTVEDCIKNQLFIIRIVFGGMAVISTPIGYHIELGIINTDSQSDNTYCDKQRNVLISLLGNTILMKYGIKVTWSIYHIGNELDKRYSNLLIKAARVRSANQGLVYTYKNIYSYTSLCSLMCLSVYGNVTDMIANILAGRLIRSSRHKAVLKTVNKIMDKHAYKRRGLGNRDDVECERNAYQGISIKVKGTISGSRRTITMNIQRGKISKGTISSAIVSSYVQAKTTTGTRGVTVSFMY